MMKKICYVVLALIICTGYTACGFLSTTKDDIISSSALQTTEETEAVTEEATENNTENLYNELIYESERVKIMFCGLDLQKGKYKINLFVENLTEDTLWITSDSLTINNVDIPVKDDYYIEPDEKTNVPFKFRESYLEDAGIADFDSLEIELVLTDLRYEGLLSSTYEEKTGKLKITL